jgi:mono/diheme cytochrome c family protein
MSLRYLHAAPALLLAASLASAGDAPATEPPAVGQIVVDVYGLPAAPKPPPLTVTERARTTFATRCAQCHGPTGHGDGPVAKSLQPRPRNFSLVTWQHDVDDARIAKVVQMGGIALGLSPVMPPHPDLKGEELAELITLLRSFAKPAGATVVLELERDQAAPTNKRVRLAGSSLRTRFSNVPAGEVRVSGFVDLDGDGKRCEGEPTFESPAAPVKAGEVSKRKIKLAKATPAAPASP